jgi:cytochrome P450 family 110
MQLPDGPKNNLFLRFRTTLEWVYRPVEFLDECAQRYGDPICFGGEKSSPVIYFSNPEDLKQIFTASPDLFSRSSKNHFLRTLLGQNSLFLLDSDAHNRQRRLLMPPFHGERMRVYGQYICEATEQTTKQWSLNQPFVIRESIQEISLKVIINCVFGLTENYLLDEIFQLLKSFMAKIDAPAFASFIFIRLLQKDLGPWSPWGDFLDKVQQLDKLIYQIIAERRTELLESRSDILSLMMMAQDEQGEAMTDVELRDELITLLFTGNDTTVSAVVWALYWIDRLPVVQERLLEELDAFSSFDPSHVVRLPYLTAVCQETLRIYPVALFATARILKAPFQVGNYLFNPGTILVPSIYLTHRRADIYPEPTQFQPERFLEKQYSPYEYFPFGGGHRSCIGMAFAMFQMKVILARILCDFKVSRTNQDPVKPSRRSITVAPPSNMQMIVHQRFSK